MQKKKQPKKGFAPPADHDRPTADEFVRMVESHDPTYVWSTDPAERERGEWERSRIDHSREIIGDEVAVIIWNRAMRRKVVPSMIEEFLWKVRKVD